MLRYVLPGFFGVFLAFGFITFSHTHDMRWLMASVAQITQPQYDADIVMERTDTSLRIILWKNATAVDILSFRLMSNPDNRVVFYPTYGAVIDEWEGVAYFTRSFAHQDIQAGSIIAEFYDIARDFPIALTDAEFLSGEERYSLTSKGE